MSLKNYLKYRFFYYESKKILRYIIQFYHRISSPRNKHVTFSSFFNSFLPNAIILLFYIVSRTKKLEESLLSRSYDEANLVVAMQIN